MLIKEEDYLEHVGTKRHSGRYPWGSGQDPEERSKSLLGAIAELRSQKMSEAQIAKSLGFETTTQLRAEKTIAINAKKAADISMATRLKYDKGMSNTAIAKRMFGSETKESTVRALLDPAAKDKADILTATSDMLRNRVGDKNFVDIGKGVENHLGIAPTKLNTAVAMLEAEGYTVHRVPVPQVGTTHDTTTKVLAPPGTEWKDVMQNREKIVGFKDFSTDGGRNWDEIKPPIAINSKRVQVVYGPEGGAKSDGVIYVRPGVHDLDMGGTHFAQARILIDGTHYLKGMVVQKDDLPSGVDVQFHTNKEDKGNKLAAMKPVQRDSEGNVDSENPFGSAINRQIIVGGKVKSAINIVNEEANWDNWSKNLASQFLSKQKPELVKSQLNLTYANKKAQLDEILSLTNPTVKARLLQSYADDMDASAVHLKAAAMPRQKTHVILPINSLKENEVYAPGYRDGERVVLVRYPHGGTFEIPELTVNNRNAMGNKLIGKMATTAIGINHKVAGRLSGADFDGDTVVVIPNNKRRITTSPPLPGLKGFDPQSAYPKYPGMKVMSNTQTEMGKISNLITDMTIGGATHTELAAAVRHSMVVIDAEKHSLNYKQSAIDNGISALVKKYQNGPQGGASTIISKSTGSRKILDRKLRPQSEGGPIDKKTGKLVYVETGKMVGKRVVNKETGEVTWVKEPKKIDVERGALVDDAHMLIDGDGTAVERMYADYSNHVRELANTARRDLVNNTHPLPYSPSAKEVYTKEVSSLNAKLHKALQNAPLERQAQVVANSIIKMKKEANPDLYNDKDALKKVKSQALKTARNRTGADKDQVEITPREWEAIQAGAVTHTKLKAILDNADVEKVKQLATPKSSTTLTTTKISMARALAAAGYSQAEIADHLGISVSTLRRALKD